MDLILHDFTVFIFCGDYGESNQSRVFVRCQVLLVPFRPTRFDLYLDDDGDDYNHTKLSFTF